MQTIALSELEKVRLQKRRLVYEYQEWLKIAVSALTELERKRLAVLRAWTNEELREQRVSFIVELFWNCLQTPWSNRPVATVYTVI